MNKHTNKTPKGQRRLRLVCRNGHPIEHSRVNPKGYLRCRDCERDGRNRYYNNHKETRSIVNAMNDRKLRYKRRQQALDFLGGKCATCGFSDWRALQIDHVNGGGTRESKGRAQSQLFHDVYVHKDKYQLLCANCNSIKRIENNELAHKY